MKKRWIVLLLILCLTGNLWGYKDWNGNISQASYVGVSNSVDIQLLISKLRNDMELMAKRNNLNYSPNIPKLTKKETQLLNYALEEYELEAEEIYTISIVADRIIMIVVRIDSISKDDTYNYTWWDVAVIN